MNERRPLNRRGKAALTISSAFCAFVLWRSEGIGGAMGLAITLVFAIGGAVMCFSFRNTLWSQRPRNKPNAWTMAAVIAASVVVPTRWFENPVGAVVFGTTVGFLVAASLLAPSLRDSR